MKKELISVIVPIYNVEKYLSKCINSILEQTYKNLEIILIDDGSDDSSPQICDKYSKKDKRIKVIHKENKGVSSSRNKGLELSTGKYIVFVDSDDYIDKQMIEKLYNNLIENKADISVCNHYYNYQKDTFELKKFLHQKLTIDNNDKFYNIYNDYSLSTIIPWGKIYKKEIFANIRYPIGKIHEDEAIILDILTKASRVSYFDEPLYYYVKRDNSITNNFNLKRLDIIDIHESRIKKLKNNYSDNLLYLEYSTYIKRLVKIIIPGLYSINEYEKATYYQKKYKKLISYVLSNFKISNKEKIKWIIIKYFPSLYLKKHNITSKNSGGDL